MNLIQFQQAVSSSNKPIVVDFWAEWCVPCRVTKPILEKLARDYAGQIEFMPVNADDSREVLARFQVIGIPTVLAMRGGEVLSRVTGAQSEAGYRLMFESLATGREVQIPVSTFDRLLRLGAGTLLLLVGITTSSWVALGFGSLIAFLAVYDRCPIWRAVMETLRRK